MKWTPDLERLCALDEHPEIHDPITQLFQGITVRYVLEALIPKIDDGWPEQTRQAFKVAAVTAALGVVAADEFTVAILLAHLALETALRQRFEGDHPEGHSADLARSLDHSLFRRNGVLSEPAPVQGRTRRRPRVTGSYNDLRRWCLERGYLTAGSAEQAKWAGYARNDLAHASTETRLPPGMALRAIGAHFAIASEVWARR